MSIMNAWTACAVRTRQLTGIKRNLAAFLFGACATAALPPVFALPLLLVAFPGLMWLLESASSQKRAFWDGWWFGLGHFITGLYWFCVALLVDPVKFAWLIPFTLLGLNGIIAIYIGVFGLIFFHFNATKPIIRLTAFTLLWVGMEYARSILFTGFPWNLIGYIWTFADAPIQSAYYMTIYGLSALTIALFTAPALLADKDNSRRTTMVPGLVILFLALANAGWGAHRLSQHPTQYVEGITLRLVQANIPQSLKWDPKHQSEALRSHIRLTRSEGYENVTHVIWPETAMPYMLEGSSPWPDMLAQTVVPPKGALITGVLRARGKGEDWKIWNSLQAIGESGQIIATYDKHHLVPFGEFVPFRSILPIDKITPGSTDFSRGAGPATLQLDGLPSFSPLICYEIIFPGEVTATETKPEWLLNITNDAWFGRSSGPYQHFHMARMRAVEEGLPLMRVANSGISAAIDAYGRVLKHVPLGASGVITSPLPAPINN